MATKDSKADTTPQTDRERVDDLLNPEQTAEEIKAPEMTRQDRAGAREAAAPPRESPGTQPIPGVHSVGTPAAVAPSRIATEKNVDAKREQVLADEEESRKELADAAKDI